MKHGVRFAIIDGYNLLYAMHEHAPSPAVGRTKLTQVIREWARKHAVSVTVVFDGGSPISRQKEHRISGRVRAVFSAPRTADDVIVEKIGQLADPGIVQIVTTDTAIKYEANRRRCAWISSEDFVQELFAADTEKCPADDTRENEKPDHVSQEEAREWLKTFGFEDLGDEKGPRPTESPTGKKPRALPADNIDDWLTIFGANESIDSPEEAKQASEDTPPTASDGKTNESNKPESEDPAAPDQHSAEATEKPELMSPDETEKWLKYFGLGGLGD